MALYAGGRHDGSVFFRGGPVEKVKYGVAISGAVLCLAGAMPGLVFALDGLLRSPAEAGTAVLLVLAGLAACAYVATGVANVVAWQGKGITAGARWVRRAVVGFASAAIGATALLLVPHLV